MQLKLTCWGSALLPAVLNRYPAKRCLRECRHCPDLLLACCGATGRVLYTASSEGAVLQALRSPLLAATISHLQHACLTSPWTVRVSGAQALAKVMRWIPGLCLTRTHPEALLFRQVPARSALSTSETSNVEIEQHCTWTVHCSVYMRGSERSCRQHAVGLMPVSSQDTPMFCRKSLHLHAAGQGRGRLLHCPSCLASAKCADSGVVRRWPSAPMSPTGCSAMAFLSAVASIGGLGEHPCPLLHITLPTVIHCSLQGCRWTP